MVLFPLGSTPSCQDVGVSFTDARTRSMWHSILKPWVGVNCWKFVAKKLEGACDFHTPYTAALQKAIAESNLALQLAHQSDDIFKNIWWWKAWLVTLAVWWSILLTGFHFILNKYSCWSFGSNSRGFLYCWFPFNNPLLICLSFHLPVSCQVGDGTNFVLVFAGALLDAAEELLRMVSTVVFLL